MSAIWAEVFGRLVNPTPVGRELHDRTDAVRWQDELHLGNRLAKLLNVSGIRNLLRVVDVNDLAVTLQDLISYVRCGLDQIDIRFLLQSLLDDFHMQHAEEAAAKTESQGF